MRDAGNLESLFELHPDYVGMIFYERSPRYAGRHIEQFLEVDWPESVEKVGVFVNEKPERVIEISERLQLDYVQLHGGESVDYCKEINSAGVKVIKSFGVDDAFDFRLTALFEDVADYFLFDTRTKAYGGSGRRFNWGLLSSYRGRTPFLLSGGIGLEDAPAILHLRQNLHIHAVDVNSMFEISPGVKNIEAIRSFRDLLQFTDMDASNQQ